MRKDCCALRLRAAAAAWESGCGTVRSKSMLKQLHKPCAAGREELHSALLRSGSLERRSRLPGCTVYRLAAHGRKGRSRAKVDHGGEQLNHGSCSAKRRWSTLQMLYQAGRPGRAAAFLLLILTSDKEDIHGV